MEENLYVRGDGTRVHFFDIGQSCLPHADVAEMSDRGSTKHVLQGWIVRRDRSSMGSTSHLESEEAAEDVPTLVAWAVQESEHNVIDITTTEQSVTSAKKCPKLLQHECPC